MVVMKRGILIIMTRAQILDGKHVQSTLVEELTQRVSSLKDKGITPGLGTIVVGDDPASFYYIKSLKHSLGKKIGLEPIHTELPGNSSTADVLAVLDKYNADPRVSAYIVQLPLPDHIDAAQVLAHIDPAKDADGLHPENLGKIVLGEKGPQPCTPHGIIHLLNFYDIPLKGAQVSILGRGITVGRPLGLMLSARENNATVSLLHTGTRDITSYTRESDIIIAAAGVPGMITADMIKPGAVVIDVGVSRVDGKVTGDVAPDVWDKAAWVSPNPGGVGPLTVGFLMSNTVDAAEGSYHS